MILSRNDQRCCRLRVHSSRHDQPLPISCALLPHQPHIGLMSPTFRDSTGEEPLLGASRHRTATAVGVLASRPRT